jgi:hypothetical protein
MHGPSPDSARIAREAQDDRDWTARPEELPGGLVHEEFRAELELVGRKRWQTASPEERDRLATEAAVLARVALATARHAGFASMAKFIASTEDPAWLRQLR